MYDYHLKKFKRKSNALLAVIVWCFMVACIIAAAQHKQVLDLTVEVTRLRAFAIHFQSFRDRIYNTVPIDYLTEMTIDDFKFERFMSDQNYAQGAK